MRLLRALAFTLFALPCVVAASQISQTPQTVALPPVTAYTLDRAKVTLPEDFAAPLNLLILSFDRDQQPQVDGWLPAITAPTVQTWWLFVSPRENGLYRWWLNASLRGSLLPSQPRRYMVPLYVNKTQFLQSLQISSEQDVMLLLTDKAGHVLWRTAGAVNESKKEALTSFVTKTSSH
jgi:hypothetical protein